MLYLLISVDGQLHGKLSTGDTVARGQVVVVCSQCGLKLFLLEAHRAPYSFRGEGLD
jgi:hypothetical protein